jgi:hypothetical protein
MTTARTPTTSRPRRLAALAGPAPAAAPGPRRPWRLLVAGCVALAALSLLAPSEPTYDPWAWLIWGREITEWNLSTVAGPSWKPLPVLFTAPFSLLGDDVAPQLWLVVGRAGGLLALAMTYRLAARLGGVAAGLVAAGSLALADLFVSFSSRGNSEGLLVGLALWAVERHLDGRPRDAFLLGAGCALLRPETWPFVALYGVWLVAASRRDRRPGRTVALVGGAGAAVALLWFVPEYLGSGNLLRAASRALEPVPDSPAQAARPFVAVFENSASALWPPAYAGGVLACVLAVLGRARDPRATVVLALAAASTVLMVTVAILAEIGFTGNLRYVALPAAIVCVLAGVGWSWLVAAVRSRFGLRGATAAGAVLLALAVPFALSTVPRVHDQLQEASDEAARAADLPAAIAAAGGEAAVRRCGSPRTGAFETQLVAWHLHVHQREVGLNPSPPATLVALRGNALAREPGFTTLGGSRRWVIRASC